MIDQPENSPSDDLSKLSAEELISFRKAFPLLSKTDPINALKQFRERFSPPPLSQPLSPSSQRPEIKQSPFTQAVKSSTTLIRGK